MWVSLSVRGNIETLHDQTISFLHIVLQSWNPQNQDRVWEIRVQFYQECTILVYQDHSHKVI